MYNKEIRIHQDFVTFAEVYSQQLSTGTKGFRLVPTFSYKMTEYGHITGHKVRLRFPGNRLLSHVNYDPQALAVHATYRASVRLVIALAVTHGILLKHVDISAAFIHEKYVGHEPIYVEHIPTFVTPARTAATVMRVIDNIYGTRQAPRVYAERFRRHLTMFGYVQSAADRNVYVERETDEVVVLVVTVDDFCVAASSEAAYQQLLTDLRRKYAAKDLRRAKRLLGWSIRQVSNGGVHISQPYLAQRLIDFLNLTDAHPSGKPYVHCLALGVREPQDAVEAGQQPLFARAVGILRYLVDSKRPDLAYIAGLLARGMQNSTALAINPPSGTIRQSHAAPRPMLQSQ